MRRILFCVGTIVLLVAIAVCMMIIGRGHTMYFDNKKLEYDGRTLDTYRRINVSVNGEQVARLSAKDRGMATFMGQSLTFDLEVTREKGDAPVYYTYTLKVPFGQDGTVINLPGLLAELPEVSYMSEFVPLVTQEEEPEEETAPDEFDMSGDF